MYNYNDFDSAFIAARNAQFRDQVNRRLNDTLTEDEFKPLRLMNGLYLQLHAYMLRVAVPYGALNSRQLHMLADIATKWDKGYGHVTTRQNMQFNWPKLSDVPDILDALAEVNLHAIQTSGNTVRNVTSDPFAGASIDEIADPRPVAELIRQWSTDHPEFQFLGRKFKIAVNGATADRAVLKSHDLALQIRTNDAGQIGYEVMIGGGLGRTPMIGKTIVEFLPEADILPYIESVLSVYNLLGRRDNKYKARIKITVHENGLDHIRTLVNAEFARLKPTFKGADQQLLNDIRTHFAAPTYINDPIDGYDTARAQSPGFKSWSDTNLSLHKNPNYAIATISLKAHGATPGDISAEQMHALADLAKTYGHNEIRFSHEQNIILPHVHKSHLSALYAALSDLDLATANIGLISDIIACPGMDYCALATARSIPIAQKIALRFDELKLEHDIGPMKLKISGCINACGHHHVGHIGILGLDRAGVENYQITLGGDGTQTMSLGERAGPGFSYDDITPAIERLVMAYLDLRASSDETFLETYRRLGLAPFKSALYPAPQANAA